MSKEIEASKLKRLYQSVESERGLSHPKLAEMMETDKSQISHMLNGRNPINLQRGVQFCKAIGCELEDFSPRLALEASVLVNSVTGRVNGVTGSVKYLVGRDMNEIVEIIKKRAEVSEQIFWPKKHSIDTYAMAVEGNANSPDLPHGTTAIVDMQKVPEVGDMIAITGNKKVKFARFQGDGFAAYVNKDYPDRIFKMPKTSTTIGVVIGHQQYS